MKKLLKVLSEIETKFPILTKPVQKARPYWFNIVESLDSDSVLADYYGHKLQVEYQKSCELGRTVYSNDCIESETETEVEIDVKKIDLVFGDEIRPLKVPHTFRYALESEIKDYVLENELYQD